MLKSSTRRWIAGLGVAGAFVAAAATPAAADPVDEVLLYFPDTTVALGEHGKDASAKLFTRVNSQFHDATVRYDYRSLAGKVKLKALSEADDCETPEEGVLLCREHSPIYVDETYGASLTELNISATDEAQAGDAGELRISFRVGNLEKATYTSHLQVGEGVDLATGPDAKFDLKPGDSFTAPVTVVNAGKTTVDGVIAYFDNDYAIRAVDRFSNCLYAGESIVACEFDEKIPAGEARSVTFDYQLGKDTYAPGSQYGNIRFMTPADFEDLIEQRARSGAKTAKHGTGPKLTLTEASAKAARSVQTDTDRSNDFWNMSIDVGGKNGADLEAIGAELTGKVGAEVTARVGLRNNGPATLDRHRADSQVTFVDVTLPAGTRAVEVPENCAPFKGDGTKLTDGGKPGAPAYRCFPGVFAKAGEELTNELRLRIEEIVPGASGTVTINAPCECTGGFKDDLKPANDTAKILLTATGGQGGGDGGSLPITGESTALIAGIGALLLAAGVGGYVVARRRKTRFVA
ncbi:LPXTG cell wall anchor domain-containing protein [Micromonospora sp. 15K316]|uniref:LPXTG cell wall anchor domain-containing protein n=1 Tax=Micromonospora sp. 15K316 TaxID=2530376 RepID=UPI0010492E40|nr:LPXTG cell wall anchor domain-containing protein [Micromonospora sp. 15K316]TDC33095.1 LPXTG cell wall anchor domain-containing protein [Micromonospora sp. 15K316]